jgi:DNA helicase-2/ATP-dependent DNA helicase PcrA
MATASYRDAELRDHVLSVYSRMKDDSRAAGTGAAYLEKLNESQRAAVEHSIGLADGRGGGPLLVIAGAGSGKTNTLAHRVAHLIVNGTDPRRILLMTFSRRAASEMARRVERLCARGLGGQAGPLTDALTWAGTFHGIGARILRDYAGDIGLDPKFTIHDREDSADLMNLVRHGLGFTKTESRFPTKATCLSIYSRAVNAEAPLQDVLRGSFPWCSGWEQQLRELFAGYVEAKQAQNVLDYDDLLLYWAQTMGEPSLAEEIGGRWDHVLVDEYQDTNRLQASILMGLKPRGRGLTVVGDDAQAIYSFRAATVRNILDFPQEFSPAADVITLDRNYRSTQPILAAANGVISLAKERFTKNLWTERESAERPRLVTVRDEADQARFVADEVLENREAGMRLKDQAVLFRTSHHSGPLEIELTRRNIPYRKFGGLKFLDSAHVKDMLAALRFAENPRDRVAGFRLMQLLPGVGPSTAQAALDAMADASDPLERLAELPCPARAAAD